MNVEVQTGTQLEVRMPDGTLEPLTNAIRAAHAFKNGDQVFVPYETWEKDFDGQVTAGRIGRPVIRFCPIAWLPDAQRRQVEELMVLNSHT